MMSSGSMSAPEGAITQLIKQLSGGSQEAESKLVPVVYKGLRQVLEVICTARNPSNSPAYGAWKNTCQNRVLTDPHHK